MSPSTIVSHEISSIPVPLPANITNGTTDLTLKPPEKWTYRGYSRAGTATSFELVEPKWIFDCGCVLQSNPTARPTCLFITHTHADHIQTLHQILFAQKLGKSKAST